MEKRKKIGGWNKGYKGKGFTLIELLAVIVILAVIALIASPKILNIIEKTRKSAAESDGYGYIKAVENAVASHLMRNHSDDVSGVYKIEEEGNLKGISELSYERKKNNLLYVERLEPKLKGKRPTSGRITIGKNGTITGIENMVIDEIGRASCRERVLRDV